VLPVLRPSMLAAPPRLLVSADGRTAACSLVCRTFDAALAECCHMEGVGLLAYSPLAMGLLTARAAPAGSPSLVPARRLGVRQ